MCLKIDDFSGSTEGIFEIATIEYASAFLSTNQEKMPKSKSELD